MEFIHSRLISDRTAATELFSKDLPTNPISHLIFSMEFYNATDEATLAEVLAFINKLEVSKSGNTIFSLCSEDICGLNQYLYKSHPILTANVATDNETRSISLIVPFGRKIFDPKECYPATKKGELTFYMDITIPATSCDNAVINVDCIELPEATPERYLKCTSKTIAAPGAVGDNDVDLPIGNDIMALQFRMTTFPATSSHTYGVDNARILINNKEKGFASSRAQCLVGAGIFKQSALPRDIAAFGNILPANTIWLDFDPQFDSNFLLQTAGVSSAKARLTMGVNEATYMAIYELVRL
jgi:hypothetical protein